MWYNVINILDISTMKIVKILSNLGKPNTFLILQKYSEIYGLSDGTSIIMCSNSFGVFTWAVNLNSVQLTAEYNDYIPEVNLVQSSKIQFRNFEKYPYDDIFFFNGNSSQIVVVKIQDLKQRVYLKMFDQKFLSDENDTNSFTMIYQEPVFSESKVSMLVIGDEWRLFFLPFGIFGDSIFFPTIQSVEMKLVYQYNQPLFKLEGTDKFVMASMYFATSCNLSKSTAEFYLYFMSDGYSRRTMYEELSEDVYVFPNANNLYYSQLSNPGDYHPIQRPNFSTNISQIRNSLCRVKLCTDCLFIRLGDDLKDIALTTLIYPFNSLAQEINIFDKIGLKWANINTNLDPFKFEDSIWIVFSFPFTNYTPPDYLCLLFNASTGDSIKLKGDPLNLSWVGMSTAFALISIENALNQEIITIDNLGNIYVWDFTSKNYKFSAKIDSCTRAEIGDLFHYQNKKWLIVACEDFVVRIYEFDTSKTIWLTEIVLYSMPLALNAYSDPGIIVISDFNIGDVHIYKFEKTSQSFKFFITLNKGRFKDTIIGIELIDQRKTLWVQYQLSNLFFGLGACIHDINSCIQCFQSTYFRTIEATNEEGNYGKGNISNPFTGSNNFITPFLKAQMYKELIDKSIELQINIRVDPEYPLTLRQSLLNNDINKIISLSILTTNLGSAKDIQINAKNYLSFSNYKSITLLDTIINFQRSPENSPCGIQFSSTSDFALLEKIQILQSDCFRIEANSTLLQLESFNIVNLDFTNSGPIIQMNDCPKLDIYNLNIEGLTLGKDSSIVSSNNQLVLILTNTQINSSVCPSESIQSNLDQSLSVPLFTAGLIQIYGLEIKDNIFCKKNLFTTKSSLVNYYYDFEFFDMKILNNQFQQVSENIFYSSQFYQRVLPWHSLTFRRVIFKGNSLINRENDENDLNLAHFVTLFKIGTITFDDVQIINQYGISLFLSEYSESITFNNVRFENDEATLDIIPDIRSIGCFLLYEILNLEITGLIITRKKAFDDPLILINNYEYQDASILIQQSSFTKLNLIQSKNNLNASPIVLDSVFKISFHMIECVFEENYLQGLINSFTFSTTALWISNFVGKVSISNSSFLRSSSNSLYNFIYIASNEVLINDSIFSEQSFSDIDYNSHVKGGFINLSTINADFHKCKFEKSFAEIGSFIVINSFGSDLNVNMSDTSFKEGYALSDGGAIYINLQNSILNMKCTNLVFENIYTFRKGASVILFQSESLDQSRYHQALLDGGSIKNWIGTSDNQFTYFKNMNFTLKNFADITFEEFDLETSAFKFFKNLKLYSQGSLISAESSIISLNSLLVHDLSKQIYFVSIPLLVEASNSTVYLNDFKLKKSTFVRTAIEITNSELLISSSNFIDLSQDEYNPAENERLLEANQSDISTLIDYAPTKLKLSSLVILNNSTLITKENSIFSNINCKMECNGSTISLQNSTFSISNTLIEKSSSDFGGAIFINRIQGKNIIRDTELDQNSATYSGGAIYLQAEESDIFGLDILNSKISYNQALFGKGGGIYVRSDALNDQHQTISIQNSEISSNTAQVGGSLNYKGILPTIYGNNLIKNNIAILFGNNSVTYPSHMKIRNLEQFQQTANATISTDLEYSNVDAVVNAFQSGADFPLIQFALSTDEDEEVTPVSETEKLGYTITVSFSSNTEKKESYSIRGTTTVYFQSDSFSFNDLQLVGIPDTSAILEFTSEQIYLADNESNKFIKNYSYKIRVNFRNCILGEKINEYSDFIECTTCSNLYYSFDIKSCYNCPTGATCHGGANLVTNPGYWRREKYSEEVILCQNLENNCIGGVSGNEICYKGHIGALCEECDIFGEYWTSQYAKSGKFSCVDCSEIKNNFIIVTLLTCWTLISMTLAIRGSVELFEHQAAAETFFSMQQGKKPDVETKSPQQLTLKKQRNSIFTPKNKSSTFQSIKRINLPAESEDKSGIYIKMLTNYIQIVGSIATFNLSIPSGIVEFPSSVGEPLQQTMNSLDCALKDISSSIPIIYIRLIFSQIIPCLYFMIFLIGYSIQHCLKKKKGEFPWYIIWTAFIFLVIYVQPDLVAQTISLMSCREIGGVKYILSNVSFECYTEDFNWYSTVLVAPLLISWVLLLPGFLFMMLKLGLNNLSSVKVKLRFGFLYREYREKAFYWEFVKMAEKIAIIISLNFYSQSIVMKGILVFIVITFYGITAMIIQPYESNLINEIDVQSTNICAVTVLLGIFIYKNNYSYFVYLSFGIIVIINLWYLFSMIKKLLNNYLEKFNEPIQQVLIKLSQKWVCFSKLIKKIPQKRVVNRPLQLKMQFLFRKFLKLDPKKKKEICLQLYSKELDVKYKDIFKKDSEEIEPIVELVDIEMTNSTFRSNVEQQQEINLNCYTVTAQQKQNLKSTFTINRETQLTRESPIEINSNEGRKEETSLIQQTLVPSVSQFEKSSQNIQPISQLSSINLKIDEHISSNKVS